VSTGQVFLLTYEQQSTNEEGVDFFVRSTALVKVVNFATQTIATVQRVDQQGVPFGDKFDVEWSVRGGQVLFKTSSPRNPLLTVSTPQKISGSMKPIQLAQLPQSTQSPFRVDFGKKRPRNEPVFVQPRYRDTLKFAVRPRGEVDENQLALVTPSPPSSQLRNQTSVEDLFSALEGLSVSSCPPCQATGSQGTVSSSIGRGGAQPVDDLDLFATQFESRLGAFHVSESGEKFSQKCKAYCAALPQSQVLLKPSVFQSVPSSSTSAVQVRELSVAQEEDELRRQVLERLEQDRQRQNEESFVARASRFVRGELKELYLSRDESDRYLQWAQQRARTMARTGLAYSPPLYQDFRRENEEELNSMLYFGGGYTNQKRKRARPFSTLKSRQKTRY
jgi:hypothetical protein